MSLREYLFLTGLAIALVLVIWALLTSGTGEDVNRSAKHAKDTGERTTRLRWPGKG